jgi:hypothetical protein
VATTVVAGQSWIDNASRGRIPPPGYAFPLEMAYVSPRPYERLIVDGAAPAVGRSLRGLRPGRLLLADAEARLRGAGTGLGLDLEGRHFVTGGTVPEWATSGYEALATGPPPAGWGVSYLLVRSRQRAPLRPAVRALLGSGAQFRIRRQGETPFLRYADAVTPQLDFKLRFGEFPARPLPDGRIDIAPAWHRSHITSGKLPIVGTATCNRSFFPLIKAALRKVEAAGLGHLIKPSGFAGCYSARFIGSDPHGRLSSHAWGAAVDLNAPDNPMGSTPTMDPRIVGLMKSAGLNWGGDWLVPDGMHFEWAAPHSAAGPPGK